MTTQFDKEAFETLANQQGQTCISLYIKAAKPGETNKINMDMTSLKNELRALRGALEERLDDKREIKKLLEPLEAYQDTDHELWHNGLGNTAFFRTPDDIWVFHVPDMLSESFHKVDERCFLLPMLPSLQSRHHYYILDLSLDEVRLLQCNDKNAVDVTAQGDFPKGLTDVVGGDYKEKSLQLRSGQGEGEGTIYHGHGLSNANFKKEEILKYCQAVDRAVTDVLGGANLPLLVYSLEYIFPIYKEANHYAHLEDQPIPHKDDASDADLTGDAFIMLERKNRGEQREEENVGTKLAEGLASDDPSVVVPASIEGKIEKLYVSRNGQLMGSYDAEKHKIKQQNGAEATDLLNLAAIETANHGGQVLWLEEDLVSADQIQSPLLAEFRYA
jgi:hypothetical protein